MHMESTTRQEVKSFPEISFRKKRLSVAIHSHFDMERAEEVGEVKQRVAEALAMLNEEGRAKVCFTLTDL
jgi:hypothetical protein